MWNLAASCEYRSAHLVFCDIRGIRLHYRLRVGKAFAEWSPKTFTLCDVRPTLGLSHSWISPIHYEIADLARDLRSSQYSGCRVDFMGSSIQSDEDMERFKLARIQLSAIVEFAVVSPHTEIDGGDIFRNTSFVVDSARLGDCWAGTWGIFARGTFHPFHIIARESQSLRV